MWGDESEVLRMTRGALVASLIGCGLVVTGGRLSLDLMTESETHIATAAARRVGGMGRNRAGPSVGYEP